jgi:muconolactone delta-isomerase
MQFLIIAKPSSPPPPEMLMSLIDAMEAWLAKNQADGTLKSSWSFAGTQGGGGILEVDSHEQLDAIMAGFPFGPFNSIEVHALSDLGQSLAANRAVVMQMMEMMGGAK